MEKKSNVVLVIPAYEPDDRMLTLMETLKEAQISPVVFVDDGSGPDYRHYFEIAEKKYGYTVLVHAVNLGKGRALKTAFNYVLNTYPDVVGVVTADSDGQHTVADIQACEKALVENPNHLILGVRNFDGKDIPWKSVFGNKLTCSICKWLCGVSVSDTQTGLRGISCAYMKKLMETSGERFEFETNMLIDTKDYCEITEVPIETIYDSVENHVTHFDPIRDSIRIYKIFGRMFLKFVFSSLSSSVVDLFLFSVFCSLLLGWSEIYYVTVATIVARVISAAYNYFVNYHFVFNSKKRKSVSGAKYFALVIVQMLLSAGFVTLGVYLLPFVPELVVKIFVDGFLFFISYLVQRKYIF